MKKKKKKKVGLVEKIKRLIKAIELEDMRTDGKFSSALIAILCLLAIGCFALAFLVFDQEINMKNNLNSLNDYLFEQLERLNDDEELAENGALEKELKRAKAITGISTAIVNNAKVILDAKKWADEIGESNENKLLTLQEPNKNNDQIYETTKAISY